MIIIKPGETQLPELWWVDAVATCSTCGAQVRLEKSDRWRKMGGKPGLTHKCVTEHCKGYLHVKGPILG